MRQAPPHYSGNTLGGSASSTANTWSPACRDSIYRPVKAPKAGNTADRGPK